MLRFLLLSLALSLTTVLPLAWKWQLGMRRTAVAVVFLSLMTGALTEVAVPLVQRADGFPFQDSNGVLLKAGVNWLLTVWGAFAVALYRFFRDPERTVPGGSSAIVSPADGEVLYVHASLDRTLPVSTKGGRSYTLVELTKTPLEVKDTTVIGIGMSFLDTHVNRTPIAGRIAMQRHFPGLFGSLRRPEMVFRNERMTTIIDGDDMQIAVVQIASRLVRQIVSFVREGQQVELGQRIGMIRFGSQVDLVLPRRADLTVAVKPGDRVRAGESIVAILDVQRALGDASSRDALTYATPQHY